VTSRPSDEALSAFDAHGPLRMVDERGGRTWIGERVVLKRDIGEREWTWIAENLNDFRTERFRVPKVFRARDGRLFVDGWCAQERVDGFHAKDRWPDVIDAGERFHRHIADVPRPDYLEAETHPWAVADRVAFDEERVEVPGPIASEVARLQSFLAPCTLPAQVIHSDLTNNVLFHDDLPPAIIDLTPRFRPAGFAIGIVVFDALAYESASPALFDAAAHVDAFDELLARAAICRLITAGIAFRDDQSRIEEHARTARPVVDLIVSRFTS